MATRIDHEQQQRTLIERFRSTGYEGREPWIAALDAPIGERVVAVRQLEACATMPACAWRDEADDEIGLWGLLHECILDLLLSLGRIVESSMPNEVAEARNGAGRQTLRSRAWKIVRHCLQQFESSDPTRTPYGESVVAFLMAVMLLRQIVEHDARGGDAVADIKFVPHSTNVYAGFLEFLLSKLARSPFGNLGDTTLEQFCGNLEKWQVASEAQIAIPAMQNLN